MSSGDFLEIIDKSNGSSKGIEIYEFIVDIKTNIYFSGL